jgi:beta-glucosidase
MCAPPPVYRHRRAVNPHRLRDRRVHHLEGFKRISLKPGESKTVTIKLRKEQLMQFGMDGKQSLAKGEYTVFVGGGQPGFTAGVLSAKVDL